MIRQIHLHGELEKKYGAIPLSVDVDNTLHLISALESQLKGFRLRDYEGYSFVKEYDDGSFAPITKDLLTFGFGKAKHIHVVPKVDGEWAGAAYVAGMVAAEGTFMYYVVLVVVLVAEIYAMSAISAALAPDPDQYSRNSAEQRPSALFNGPVNVTTPGYPVPLVYGRFNVGSVVISTGFESEQIGSINPTLPPETGVSGTNMTDGG